MNCGGKKSQIKFDICLTPCHISSSSTMLKSAQGVAVLVHLLLCALAHGVSADTYSSGDITREHLIQYPPENDPQHRARPDTPSPSPTPVTPGEEDLENELMERVQRRHGRWKEYRRKKNHRGQEQDVQSEEEMLPDDVQLSDPSQIGRLMKNLQLEIKQSRTSQVRTR